MPVEIRELIIRAVVQETPKSGEGGAAPADAADAGPIIEECVRQILKILKTKGER
ncbi:MAG: DUF5908 family protein [Candidatus Methylumidiphilus sp.]